MAQKNCELETLASTAFAQAQLCRHCNMVHLHMHNLSLRLNVSIFLEITDTLATAADAIRRVPDKPAAPTRKLELVK